MKRFILCLLFCIIANLSYADTVMIQVRFRVETSHGQYNDALYFTQAEYASTSKAIIDSMKQERVDNWIYILENPPLYVEPTKEELQSVEADLRAQLDEVQAKILEKEPLPIE